MTEYGGMSPWGSDQDFDRDLAALMGGDLPVAPKSGYDIIRESAGKAESQEEKEAIFQAEVKGCPDVASLRSLLEDRAGETLRQISEQAELAADAIYYLSGNAVGARLLEAERCDDGELLELLSELHQRLEKEDHQRLIEAMGERILGIMLPMLDDSVPRYDQVFRLLKSIGAHDTFHKKIRAIADPQVLRTIDGQAYANGGRVYPTGHINYFTHDFIGEKAKELIQDQYPQEEGSEESR